VDPRRGAGASTCHCLYPPFSSSSGLADGFANKIINGGPTNARYAYDGDGKRVIALVNGVRTVYIGDYFEAELGSATTFPVVVDPIISNIPYKVFLPIVCQEDTTVSVVGMTNGNFGMTLYYTHPNKTEQNSITWRTYYSAAGARIAMRSQGNSSSYDLYYFMTDHLNSTAKTIKQDGTVSEIRYAAWGETRYTSGTTPTKRQYTGQYMAEAGLYFYGARWYDNSLGRFAQPDTIIPQPGNPMAWDRYSYGFENPIRYNDPSGHCPMCIGAIGGAIGGAIYGYGSQVVNNLNQGMGLGQALTTNISGTTVLLYTGAGAVIGAGVAPLVAPAAAWIAGAIATGGTAATAAEVGTAATTAACADGDCTNEAQLASQAAQKGLEAIQNNSGTGYKTFEAFKNAQGGAGNGWAWHHIVSKLPENITQFGEQMIHNTNNLIRLPDQAGQLHRQITGIYNSINPLITGSNTMRVRDWLTTLSFEEQWMFGMNLIQKLGGGQYIIDKFK
jgi:RHS repeat-associated protein